MGAKLVGDSGKKSIITTVSDEARSVEDNLLWLWLGLVRSVRDRAGKRTLGPPHKILNFKNINIFKI